ncbi:MAG: VWA domain-containing protein [Nannocystaceae bacterium]|nr:VWA domain-containing protein [Nannocystaceae bacterium]
MGVLAGGVLLAACTSRVPVGGDAEGSGGSDAGSSDAGSVDGTSVDSTGGEDGHTVEFPVSAEVDILFVVDNSGSMGPAQGRLAQAMPTLIAALDDPERPADLRLGFTTTDNGNPWCGATSPEAGKLQLQSCREHASEFVFQGQPPVDATAVACTDVCALDSLTITPTTTAYDPTPRERPWLERTAGVANVDGDLGQAAACAAPQGIAGCGFESHLESMFKALLRVQKSDEPSYGFMRDGAVLALVIVSDEVDCSYVAEQQDIFLPESMGGSTVYWSDPTAAAPTSAVCWNAGVLCEGDGAPYDSCASSNKDVAGNVDVGDAAAVLYPISRYVDTVQELENLAATARADAQVLVAGIVGVPPGYESHAAEITYANSPDPAEQIDFGIGPGCTDDSALPNPIRARPPVREREFAEAFDVGADRNLHSVCEPSYDGAMTALADAVRDQLPDGCITTCVADSNPATAVLDPLCTVVQQAPDLSSGGIDEIEVPPCDGETVPDGADVCYEALVGDALGSACADDGWNLQLRLHRRAGAPAPAGAVLAVTCQLSANKAIDCPNLP